MSLDPDTRHNPEIWEIPSGKLIVDSLEDVEFLKRNSNPHLVESHRLGNLIEELGKRLEIALNIIGWYENRDFNEEPPPWELK